MGLGSEQELSDLRLECGLPQSALEERVGPGDGCRNMCSCDTIRLHGQRR
jgi:hypothetical protein